MNATEPPDQPPVPPPPVMAVQVEPKKGGGLAVVALVLALLTEWNPTQVGADGADVR